MHAIRSMAGMKSSIQIRSVLRLALAWPILVATSMPLDASENMTRPVERCEMQAQELHCYNPVTGLHVRRSAKSLVKVSDRFPRRVNPFVGSPDR